MHMVIYIRLNYRAWKYLVCKFIFGIDYKFTISFFYPSEAQFRIFRVPIARGNPIVSVSRSND